MTNESHKSSNEQKLAERRLRKNLQLGQIYHSRGDLEKAIEFYNECLAAAEELGDTASESHILNSLGMIYAEEGKRDRALEYYIKSNDLSSRIDDLPGMAQTLNNMGLIYVSKGELDRAEELYGNSIKILEKRDPHGSAQVYINIGSLFYDKGDLAKSTELYERSLEILESLNDVHGMAQVYNNLGSVFLARGEVDKSIEFYERSLEILESLNDVHGMAQVYNNLGSVFLARGEVDKSIEFYERSLEILESLNDVHGMAQVYLNNGLVNAKKGNFKKAREFYDRSLEIEEEIGDKSGTARTYRNIGLLERDRGNFGDALESLNRACALFSDLNAERDIWSILREQFMCLSSMRNFELAIDRLSALLEYSYKVGLVKETVLTLRDFVIEMGRISRWDMISRLGTVTSSTRDPQMKNFLKALSVYGEIRLKNGSDQEFENVRSLIRNKRLQSIIDQILNERPSTPSLLNDKPTPLRGILGRAEQHISKEKPFGTIFDVEDALGGARILVVGCGGAGNNTINRLEKIWGIKGAETIAINTDRLHLEATQADKHILIGRGVMRGLGAGGDPVLGYQSAEEDRRELREVLRGANMVFVTAGMGGGTGTGAAPVVADIAHELDALVIGVVTLPFQMEGKHRQEKAQLGLKALQGVADTVITLDNNKLMELCPHAPLDYAFSVSDEVLVETIKGISETILEPSLVNLDYADVRSVMLDGGVAMVGVGESNTKNRAREAVEEALRNRLLEVDYTNAKGALVQVSGGPDMKLAEASAVGEYINTLIGDENSRIIWGARIDESLRDSIRVMLIVTGVSPYISGRLADGASFPISDIFTARPDLSGSHNIYEYLGIDEVEGGR